MAGKWSTYARQHGLWLGEFFNRNMREVLKAGMYVLVSRTHMDSGRAAAHWTLIPSKGGNPGARGPMTFPNPDYGQAPVGRQNDKKVTDLALARQVVEREYQKVIQRAVQGRAPATHFAFHSSVPDLWDDVTRSTERTLSGRQKGYHENADLETAKQEALALMRMKFQDLMARGVVRKIPLT